MTPEESRIRETMKKHIVHRPERPRSAQEITAAYRQKCERYKALRAAAQADHEQVSMLYAEAKSLGWVLGKNESSILQDLN